MAYSYRYKSKKKPPKMPKVDYRIIGVLVAISLIAFAAGLYMKPNEERPADVREYCGDMVCQTSETCTSCQQDCGQCPATPAEDRNGTLIVAVKDAKAKLFGGNELLHLNLTVKSIQIHRSGTNDTDNNITSPGWITIFNGTKELNLMDYTGNVSALIGSGSLEPGKYTQVRLYISQAIARISSLYSGTVIAFNYNTTIPNNALKLTHPFTIESGSTLVLTLDFDPVESVIRPAGTWTFKPTLKTISEQSIGIGETPANSVEI